MAEPQTFQNHVRWFPLVHFVVTPLLLINLIWQIARLSQEFSAERVVALLTAIALMLLSVAARLQALKAQDRVIRLEENLRFHKVLPPDLAAHAANLRTGQIIALRFASDEELPELVRRTLAGEFRSTKEIKRAIRHWRGDYLRV